MKFVESHDVIYVVEMNRDGQMKKLLQLEYPEIATRFVSINKYDGLPLNARWVKESIQAKEQK
jgi:2-oxoglutarate ferredoxin oxidoreductase subunit alpha